MSTVPQSFGNMGIRLAKETTYGVLPAVPAWKRLNDIKMVPKPQFETDPFAASGMEVPSVMILNDDFTNFDVTGRLSYTSLMFVLSSLFGEPVTTPVDAVTGAYDHVWEYDGKTPIQPVSFAVDYGTAASLRRVLGVVFNSLTAGVNRGALEFGSAAFGKDLNVLTAPDMDATDVPAKPIFPLHFDIFAGDTWADADAETTKLLALYNYSLGIGERLDRSRPVNSTRSSDNVFLREEQEHTVTLRMGADAAAEGIYSNIRNGAFKFIKAIAKGQQFVTGANYEFEAATTLLIAGTDGYDTESGIHVLTWNARIARDDTSGKAAYFRLRNDIPTL